MRSDTPPITDAIDPDARRPIRSRRLKVFDTLASWLAAKDVSPNLISTMSIACALAGGAVMVAAAGGSGLVRIALLLIAAATVQLRLICNLLDGMVAERAGSSSIKGKLYNEAPDRVSDLLFLLSYGALGQSSQAMFLGALAGAMAVMTAYVRALSPEVGAKPSFVGPMAKPQRMAVLTLSLLALAFLPTTWTQQWWGGDVSFGLVESALFLIIFGCIVTCIRRWCLLLRHCEQQQRGVEQ